MSTFTVHPDSAHFCLNATAPPGQADSNSSPGLWQQSPNRSPGFYPCPSMSSLDTQAKVIRVKQVRSYELDHTLVLIPSNGFRSLSEQI